MFSLALILLIALIVTGSIVLIDKLFFASKRNQAIAEYVHATAGDGAPSEPIPSRAELPVIVDFARALFPVILLVFVLRSFIIEPFRIPSGSMIPTLLVGDFILVNKFIYGLRLPINNKKVLSISSPKHGDVMVFKFPQNKKVNFIKRVIGLPGDEITYDNKRLFVNGKEVKSTAAEPFTHTESGQRLVTVEPVTEFHGEHEYQVHNTIGHGGSRYTTIVPPDQYFVMGDNRDASNDSRGWGFVPEENIVGYAFFVWMSWHSEENSVRFSRLGSRIP